MANSKDQQATPTLGKAAALRSRSILSSIISGVELNKDQQAQIKEATGVDVEWLLFHLASGSEARNVEPAGLQVLRLTWCW